MVIFPCHLIYALLFCFLENLFVIQSKRKQTELSHFVTRGGPKMGTLAFCDLQGLDFVQERIQDQV